MHPDHARNPTRRRRHARYLDRSVDKIQQGNLATAKASRLKRSQKAAIKQKLPGAIAKLPQPIIFAAVGRKKRRNPHRFRNQAHRPTARNRVIHKKTVASYAVFFQRIAVCQWHLPDRERSTRSGG
jgi:hypothetical protein